jgi:hypothetical protein
MEEDVGKSEVYDTETQLLLFRVVIAQCKLAVQMTDTITTLYPSNISHYQIPACTADLIRMRTETDRCKLKLSDWYECVNSWALQASKDTHSSVTLYISLMYIYYQ